MPVEKNRSRHSLKIPVPGRADLAFYVWVTDEITFKRTEGIGQEIRLTMWSQPGATTRTVTTSDIEVGASDPVKVETIANAVHKETQGIGQEANWSFLTDPKLHMLSHDVEIKARETDGTENSGYTLKIKKIDKIYVKNGNGIGQEGYWTLDNRDDEDQIDFAKPDAIYDKNQGPLRLDWFQVVVKEDNNFMLVLYGSNQIAYFPMKQLDSLNFNGTRKTLSQSDWSAAGPSKCATQIKFSTAFHALSTQFVFNSNGTIGLAAFHKFYNTKNTLLTGGFATVQLDGDADDDGYGPLMNGSGNVVYTNKGEIITWNGATFTSSNLGRSYTVKKLAAIGKNGELYSGGAVKAHPDYAGSTAGGQFLEFNIDLGYLGDVGLPRPDPKYYSSINDVWAMLDGSSPGLGTITGSGELIDYDPNDTLVQHQRVANQNGNGSATAMKYRNDGNLDYVDTFTIPMSVSVSQLSAIHNYINTSDAATGESYYYYEYHYTDDYAASISFGSLSYSDVGVGRWFIEEFINGVRTRSEGQDTTGNAYRIWSFFDPFPYWFEEDVKKHNFVVWGSTWTDTSPAMFYDQFTDGYSPYGKLPNDEYMRGILHASNGKHVIQMWEYNYAGTRFIHLDKTNDITAILSGAVGTSAADIKLILLDIKKSDIDKLK